MRKKVKEGGEKNEKERKRKEKGRKREGKRKIRYQEDNQYIPSGDEDHKKHNDEQETKNEHDLDEKGSLNDVCCWDPS